MMTAGLQSKLIIPAQIFQKATKRRLIDTQKNVFSLKPPWRVPFYGPAKEIIAQTEDIARYMIRSRTHGKWSGFVITRIEEM